MVLLKRLLTSDENRQTLQRAGGHYILGEKLRGVHLNEQALTRGGRFKVIRDNLHIKGGYVGEGTGCGRFIVAYNPEQAEHERRVRERNLQRLEAELAVLAKLSGKTFNKAKYAPC